MKQFVTSVNAPPVLDLSGEVATSWKLWKEEWENYAIVVQLQDKPPAQQKAVFLNTIGSEAFRIYKSLEVPTGQNPELLRTVLNMFDEYATQYTSVICERYVFNTRNQKSDESLDAYIRSLKDLAGTCNFGGVREELIRDKIVCGLKDNTLRKRLLREKNLTLAKTIDLCRGEDLEATLRHMQGIAGDTADNPIVVKAIKQSAGARPKTGTGKNFPAKHQSQSGQKGQSSRQSEKTCLFCGRKHILCSKASVLPTAKLVTSADSLTTSRHVVRNPRSLQEL